MPEITFPKEEQGNEDWVMFPATVDGKSVMCKILLEALANRFGTPNPNAARLLKVFRGNRPAIEELARRRIGYAGYEPDGSIVIRGTDI